MNRKIKTGSIFLLAAIMVVGTVGMIIPKSFADLYEREYYNHDVKRPFDIRVMDDKDSKSVNVQELKCVNVNINVNGVDVNKQPKGMWADASTVEALQVDGATEGNGLFGDDLNIDKNLVNICVNFHNGQNDHDKSDRGTGW